MQPGEDSSRNALRFAIVLFILVKAFWAIIPAYLMGSPRLGDDALVYLWASDSSILTPQTDSLGVASIREIAAIPAADPQTQFERDRVGLRITGVSASPLFIFGGLLLHSGFTPAAAFAAMECMTAIIFAFGAAYFLSAAFTHRAAAAALIVLAFAILPRQGLHFLVPSVLSLGLGLASLGVILREPKNWRLAALALLIGACLSVHTIGKAYAAIAIGAAVLYPSLQQKKVAPNLKVIASIVVGIIFGLAVERFPGTVSAETGVAPRFDVTAAGANIAAFGPDLLQFFLRQPILAALGVGGLAFAIACKAINAQQASALALIVGTIAAASVVILPGYPGELMTRLLIPLIVLIAGFGGLLLDHLFWTKPWRAIGAAALVVATQTPAFGAGLFDNLNGRWRIYDNAALGAEVAEAPAGAPIVWLDADNALPAAFIQGAFAHQAIPFLAAGVDETTRRLSSDQPAVFAAQPPERLNSLSMFKDNSLRKRFFGWSFADVSQIYFSRRDGPIRQIYVRFSASSETLAAVAVETSGQECPASIATRDASGWSKLSLAGCTDVARVELRSECKAFCPDVRVLGFSLDTPVRALNWPWTHGEILAVAIPRNVKFEAQAVSFSWSSLLMANRAEALDGRLQNVQPLRDQSGVVWFTAEVPPEAELTPR